MKRATDPTQVRSTRGRDVWLAPVLAVAAGLALTAPAPAQAVDAVTHWSARSELYMTGGPPYVGRSRAMAQIAVHDALNGIARRYETYTPIPPIYDGGSPEAAVAAATFITC